MQVFIYTAVGLCVVDNRKRLDPGCAERKLFFTQLPISYQIGRRRGLDIYQAKKKMAKRSITWIRPQIGGLRHHRRKDRVGKNSSKSSIDPFIPWWYNSTISRMSLFVLKANLKCICNFDGKPQIGIPNVSLTTESCHVKHQLSSWASFIQWCPQHLTVIIHLSYARVQIDSINSQALAIPEAVYMEEYSDACWAHAYCWINSKIMLTSVWQW